MLPEWFHFPDYTNDTNKDDSWQEVQPIWVFDTSSDISEPKLLKRNIFYRYTLNLEFCDG